MAENLQEFDFIIITMYETKSKIKVKAKNRSEAHKKLSKLAEKREFREHELTLIETNYTGTRVCDDC